MNTDLINQIKRNIPDLKTAEIEGVLNILITQENVSNSDLVRFTGLPKEVLRKFKSSIGSILDDSSDEFVKIKDVAFKEIKGLDPQPYKWSLVDYSDPEIEKKLYDIRKKYNLEPKREYDQFSADIKTSISKVLALKDKGLIKKKRICLIGDDDLISIVMGLMNEEYIDITVVDIDPSLINTIKKIAEEYNLKGITTLTYDAREIPGDALYKSFDVVVTDPPYTRSGVELFLDRAVQMLRISQTFEGSYIYLFFGNSFKSPEKYIKVQEVINKFGLVIEDKIDKFSRYHGAESIGGASSLYILKTTPSTKPLNEELLNPVIYTFENQKEDKFPYVDHVTLKLFDVASTVVKSKSSLLKILGEFCKKHKLKVVDQKVTSFSKGGLSVTFILASSNLLVHTWPEFNAVHIDLVTCSPIHNKDGLPQTVVELFKTNKIEFNIIE